MGNKPTQSSSQPIGEQTRDAERDEHADSENRDAVRSSAFDDHDKSLPSNIARFVIEKRLGQGGFGSVFLAHDPHLNRQVAIKVPRTDKPIDEIVWKQFIDEGRAVANLRHEAIIPVYDVDRMDTGIPYVVMEYVNGQTLGEIYKESPLSLSKATNVLIEVAEGLRYAHKNSIVHRDLKPSNIMIDNEGRARIADFGLALHDNTPMRKISKTRAGTLTFMSPEQLRGENHRLDGRTDLWALGVVIYWMFAGRFPFKGDSVMELAEEICYRDPKPMRQIDDSIPAEIDRICGRCLCRLMEDRYQSAADLIEDLTHFKQLLALGPVESSISNNAVESDSVNPSVDSASASANSASSSNSSRFLVVPKGLRSFDAGDTDFFLRLLPGPVDRFGVPDSIRFWQQQLNDVENELDVGLLYGPSGCGKSSFVRAGLLPRLPENVRSVYVECSAERTESDLIRKIKQKMVRLESTEGDLSLLLHQIRNGKAIRSGERLLIVLDQFEQWLHANPIGPESPLIEALRQCDSSRIQCLILVRDDFWIPTQQFFRQLGSRIQDGKNAQALPLFNERHARKVLTGFGQAHGALPEGEKLQKSQRSFIRQAVKSLSNNGKVICAHLALFAEMMKSRDWTKAEFSRVGGWQGIGVQYLDENFGDENATPAKRDQLEGIKQILGQLIPDSAATIKGSGLKREQLIKACNAISSKSQFDEIVRTLEQEARLISQTIRTDPATSQKSEEVETETRYQLSHDILVEPIRMWLTAKQRSNWRGRAELRLGELALQWKEKKESRHLPSLFEYFPLLIGTNKSARSELQNEYLSAANRIWSQRLAVCILLMGLALGAAHLLRKNSLVADARNSIQAALDARPEAMQSHVQELMSQPNIAASELEVWDEVSTPKQRLRKLILETQFGLSGDVDLLIREISLAAGNECGNFVVALKELAAGSKEDDVAKLLCQKIEAQRSDTAKVRIAIVAVHFGNSTGLMECIGDIENTNLRTRFVHEFPNWHGAISDCLERFDEFESQPRVLVLICKALTLIREEQVSLSERNAIVSWLRKVHANAEEAGIYFVARHALRKWSPNENLDRESGSKNWFSHKVAQSHEIDFIRIEAGTAPFGLGSENSVPEEYAEANPVVDKAFYISRREISADLFAEFMKSCSDDELVDHFNASIGSDLNCDLPMYGVSRNDAAQFCNWLSEEAGKQPAYQFSETELAGDWIPIEDSNGFRLATVAEWEIACRAGSKTRFFIGDNSVRELLAHYGWCSMSRLPDNSKLYGPRAVHLPNDFGLFDMVGNTQEWNHDRFRDFGDVADFYPPRGGNAESSLEYYESSNPFQGQGHSRFFGGGIRVVIPIDH